MNKDVYFICPACNGVTNGTGCGDSPHDLIACNVCKESFPARKIGKLTPHTSKDVKPLPLYVKKENFQMLIEEL